VSRVVRLPALERTAIMRDLVRAQYPADRGVSLSHVVVEEVAPGTGWSSTQRWADVVVLGMWPSKGLDLHGYEVKASKADLKKELADPSKHEALARYCDTWTLVAWDEAVLADGIPDWWGIKLTRQADGGDRELVVHRRPEVREPEPWPRAFVCSLVRNTYYQSPGAAYVARACVEAARRGKDNGRREARALLYPLARALYGQDEWKWPAAARDHDHLVALAVDRLTQLPLGETG
jgi:hypothetical protein